MASDADTSSAPVQANGRGNPGSARPLFKRVFVEASPRFYACVVLLVVTAVGMRAAAEVVGGYLSKSAVPLKKPLDWVDWQKLEPEYEPHRIQPAPLSHEMEENLGATNYLQCYLADQRRLPSDPTRVARVSVTYNTGQPDPVPHRPEECMVASGMVLQGSSTVEMKVPYGDKIIAIPVRILTFEMPARQTQLAVPGRDNRQVIVAYFFYVNGKYMNTRTAVRTTIGSIWDRYAYYSKIELSFVDDSMSKPADRAETIVATEQLLSKLMPLLWEEHFQDWDALKAGAPPVTSSP